MQCDKPSANRWRRPNLVCITKKKMFKTEWEKGMTKWANNQIPTLDLTQRPQTCVMRIRKQAREDVENEWSCNLSEMLF